MSKGSNRQGFLLFEVMISIVIVMTILIVVGRALAASHRALTLSGDLVRIRPLVDEKMLPFNDTGKARIGEAGGEFQPPYDDYAWDIKVEPLAGSALNTLTVSLSKRKERQSPIFAVSTYAKNDESTQTP
ncbi:MAG: hypothetical protein PHS37_07485 [Candidatus Omnitrophica bacterium]|nr:hypothetical protein [Candidatus Omnitrophota bacterium]